MLNSEELINKIKSYNRFLNPDRLQKAYNFAIKAHENQKRHSGDPYSIHPIAVADIQTIIRQLAKRNIGVLITDHNVRETFGIIDHGYIMNEGELLVNGPPEVLMRDEQARRIYLGESFSM